MSKSVFAKYYPVHIVICIIGHNVAGSVKIYSIFAQISVAVFTLNRTRTTTFASKVFFPLLYLKMRDASKKQKFYVGRSVDMERHAWYH